MAANALRIPITALDKTGAAFSSVSRGLGRVGVNVAKLTVAFGTLGVAAGATIVRNQMKAIDALGKTADKIGVTTEALGAMRHAADLTGVSTSTMEWRCNALCGAPVRQHAAPGKRAGHCKN